MCLLKKENPRRLRRGGCQCPGELLGSSCCKRFVITAALAKGALLQHSITCLETARLDFTALTTPGNRQLMVDSSNL